MCIEVEAQYLYASFEHMYTSQLLLTVPSQELYECSYSTSVLDKKFFCPEYNVPEHSARQTVHQKTSHICSTPLYMAKL